MTPPPWPWYAGVHKHYPDTVPYHPDWGELDDTDPEWVTA